MSVTIKLRRGVSSEWVSQNIVLASGEPGYEINTGRFKIGNGSTAWNSLSYASVIPTGLLAGSGININLGTNGSTATISASGLNSSYISDFNEAVDDRIGSGLFVAGTGINLSYVDASGTFTVSVSGLVNNPTNNRLLTSRDSTTTGIDAESNLTFNGSLLSVSGNLVANTGSLDVLYFNTNIEPTLLQGQMAWNDNAGTADIALTDTAIINIGEHEMFRVRNETGGILYKGQAVMASGVHANGIIEPSLYTANGSVREVRFMGLVYENINDNNNGYVIHFGHVNNIDTRGNVASNIAVGDETWVDGDILYVHPTVAGKLTKNEPKHSISAAIILDAASNGKMFVRPISYGHLNDNHDVAVSGATNGQFLQYNLATDYWVPSSSGNFTTLLVNGTGVSISGHTHTASQITDFNEAVDDRIGSGLFVAGTGINLNYNDAGNSFTVSVSGLVNNPTDNRILTSRDNTTTGIDAESNATFDGTTLAVSGAISVDNLLLDGNTLSSTNSDGNIIIQPSGTGALQRDSGGNARGQYAVDWQTVRSSDTMVAAANYGVIGGGENNAIVSTSEYSTIGGGQNNNVSGTTSSHSTIGGGDNNSVSGTTSSYSTIGGGDSNSVGGDTSYYSTIGGGSNNSVSGTSSEHITIGGGNSNSVSGTTSSHSTIGGGRSNSVSGDTSTYSTIGGGYLNSVSGTNSQYSSIGGGYLNTVSGDASNYSSIGGGRSNSVSGNYSYYSSIGGGRGNSVSGTNSEYSSIGGGYLNSVSGTNSKFSTIGGGRDNSVSGGNSYYSSIGGGRYNTVSGTISTYSTIGGGRSNSVSGDTSSHSTIGGGDNNSVSGTTSSYSTIGGGYLNSVSGTNSEYSTIGGGGGNTVSGTDSKFSTIGGGYLNTVSGGNSYYSTIGGGRYNSVSGAGSQYGTIGGGRGNTVSGAISYYSTIGGGYYNTVSGVYSTIGGGSSNTASGYHSTVSGGFRGKASRYGETSHAAGRFSNDGDAQHTVLIARRLTTDATANQVLFLDESSSRLTLPAETTWAFTIKLSAYNDTDNQGGWWIFRGGIRRNAADGTALIGSLITESGFESSFNTASTSVVADDTNEALEIIVTGVASKNIRWVAVVDISQVSYGAP